MDEERPERLVVDCSRGITTRVPLTDEEWAGHRQRVADSEAAEGAAQEDAAQLAAQVAAHPDPLVRRLAQMAGIG